jgi:hypothetical protein
MSVVIAYTGTMPAKRTVARGRLDMLLTPEDEAILNFIESATGLNRTGAIRLILREGFAARGGNMSEIRDALARANTTEVTE